MKPAMFFKSLLMVVLIMAFTAVAFGQTAELSGVIRDKSEAVIPGVSITITNQATGIKRVATSNKEGVYSIPFLSPGLYKVTVQANGFQGVSRAGINLDVGLRASLDFSLDVGKVETTVEVSGEAPLLSTNSGVGTVMNRQFVGNLPLNGRSFQSLILLTPGAVITSPGSDAGLLSVNGQRGNANYFMVDGVGANIGVQNDGTAGSSDAMAGMAPGLSSFGGTNNLISIDALEEYKIQTSTYTAELGRQPGAQISLVTRSGTNQFHGLLFEYLRNEVFDARDFFATAKPALRQNQFGGTFSGPIFKDKTFFFFSYEGQRLRLPQSGVYQVPSLRLRQIAAPALKTIMDAYPKPDPSTPELVNATTKVPLGFTNYNYSLSAPGTMDAYSIRVDHTFSSKLTLFGRYNQSPSGNATVNGTTLTTPSTLEASTRTLTLGAISALTSRLTNELRFNFSSQRSKRFYENVPSGGASPIALADLITGYTGGAGEKFGAALVYFNSYRSLLYLGDSNDSFQRQMNIVDNVSLAKGSHQLKFGIDYRRLTPIWGPVEYQRMDYFQSEADVIKGIVTSTSITAQQGSRPIFNNFSVYGQDSWKLSPRLTLDLGLRWELNPAPRDANGIMPAKAVGIVGNDVTKATLAPPGTPFFKTFYRAFAPRIGTAYQLRQASGRETVLRGGFGVYYDLGNGPAARGFQYSPFSQSITRTAVPFPPTSASAAPPSIPTVPTLPISGNTSSEDPNLKLPYTLQWSVALEQSLGA
jgi:hypothetical protein